MASNPPTPPRELTTDVVDMLDNYHPEVLRDVASHAEELAEYRERENRPNEEQGSEAGESRPDDLPDDVPTEASITTKEINDNRYYYWQWREGDTIKSRYKAPINGDQ